MKKQQFTMAIIIALAVTFTSCQKENLVAFDEQEIETDEMQRADILLEQVKLNDQKEEIDRGNVIDPLGRQQAEIILAQERMSDQTTRGNETGGIKPFSVKVVPIKVSSFACIDDGTNLVVHHPSYADMDYYVKKGYRFVWTNEAGMAIQLGKGNTLSCVTDGTYQVEIFQKRVPIGKAMITVTNQTTTATDTF